MRVGYRTGRRTYVSGGPIFGGMMLFGEGMGQLFGLAAMACVLMLRLCVMFYVGLAKLTWWLAKTLAVAAWPYIVQGAHRVQIAYTNRRTVYLNRKASKEQS